MKRGGGKSKGGAFERMICKQLSRWWSGEKRDDIFWRTSGSGARATVRRRHKKRKRTFGQYGDVQAVDPVGQPLIDLCCFEMKTGYNKWSFLDVLDSTTEGKQPIEKFLYQAAESMRQTGARWEVLICRRTQRVPIIIIPWSMAWLIQEKFGGIVDNFLSAPMLQVHAMRLDDFLEWCKPEFFTEISKKKPRMTRTK